MKFCSINHRKQQKKNEVKLSILVFFWGGARGLGISVTEMAHKRKRLSIKGGKGDI